MALERAGLLWAGQGRVGLGSPSPLASRLAGLPVVSSNPPPPLMVFLQQQPSCSLCSPQESPTTRKAFIFSEWLEGNLDAARNLWNSSDAEDGVSAGYWI